MTDRAVEKSHISQALSTLLHSFDTFRQQLLGKLADDIDVFTQSKAAKRLSLELQFLVIDSANDIEGPDRKDKKLLMTCALVSQAWYRHSMRHLWRSIELSYEPPPRGESIAKTTTRAISLMALVTSNARPAKSIQSFTLNLNVTYHKNAFDGNASLLALSTFLPQVPEFHLMMPDGNRQDGEIAVRTFKDPEQNLSKIIDKFLGASILTTLHLSGSNILLDLLQQTPNLRHARFGVIDAISPPTVWRAFSFRLQSVEFIGADPILSTLLEKAPDVFTELEEVVLCGDDDEYAARILVIPQGTLRRASVDVVRCADGRFLRKLLADGTPNRPRLSWLRSLMHLSVDVGHALSEECAPLWDRTWEALEVLHSFNNLQCLTISLRYLRLGDLTRLSDPTSRGWQLLRRFLRPELAPSLQAVHVSAFWMYDLDGDTEAANMDFDAIDSASKGITDVIVKIIEGCLPKWEGDTRKIRISCSLEESEE